MVFNKQLDNRGDDHPDARGAPRAYGLTTGLPFRLACGMACVRPGARPDVQGDAHVGPLYSPQGTFCEHGLSALQINVLALVQRVGVRITPYERISRQLAQEFGMPQSAESVRGIANRLAVRGFIRRKQARDGTIRGVRFTTVDALFCPHIIGNRPDVRGDVQAEARAEPSGPPSILEEKIERKNLSISSEEDENANAIRKLEALTEDDLAYHWANLAREGFGTCQIRQIIERLAQVNIGAEKVIQGLTYVEWELETGGMRTKTGDPVASPVNWVFSSLSKNGSYRRPTGYVSPQEQTELDAAEEARRIAAARKARKNAEFDAWLVELLPEEHTAITASPNGKLPMPEDTALRLHFKSHVWPEILANRKQSEGGHEV